MEALLQASEKDGSGVSAIVCLLLVSITLPLGAV